MKAHPIGTIGLELAELDIILKERRPITLSRKPRPRSSAATPICGTA